MELPLFINSFVLRLQSLMDPWGSEVENSDFVPEFEDNFKPTHEYEKLSDSEQYLAVLGNELLVFINIVFFLF